MSSGSAATASRSTVKDLRRAGQRVVENAIQQVLDRPGELAELARADHAAAALQGVERAAHGDERLALHRILIPRREVALDLGQLFVRFLDEELDQLRIGAFRQRAHDRRPRGRHDRRDAALPTSVAARIAYDR